MPGALTRAPGVAAAALLAAAALAASALAAEAPSRESYREAAEPICKSNTRANERIFKGVKAEVRAGKLAPAARQFAKATRALGHTVSQLKRIPRPATDEARLARWFGDIEAEKRLFEAVAAKLRAGRKGAAERLVARLNANAIKTNDVVIPFQFEYCRFEPSRFT
jgi:hypothetical protein